MGRPSKKTERLEQILLAFKRCIVKYGLQSCSLEKIAEEAGLQRSLIRHFAGNRDEIILTSAKHSIQEFNHQWNNLLDALPHDEQRIEHLVYYLFTTDFSGCREDDQLAVVVFESFIIESRQNKDLQTLFSTWFDQFCEQLTNELILTFPSKTEEACASVSFALISLYFNVESLSHLDKSSRQRELSIIAAKQLIQTLGTPEEKAC